MNGVWLAFYGDRSELAIFEDEVEALRYAVKMGAGMQVAWWPVNTGIGVPMTVDHANGSAT